MYGFNLSTYTFTNPFVKGMIYALLFIATLIFSLYNYSDSKAVHERLSQSSVEIKKLKVEISSLKKVTKEKVGDIDLNDKKGIEKLSAKIDFINSIIYENNFSWSELFYSLEKASPKNISITSIKPSYDSRKITISGMAKYSRDIATLVENLKGTSFIKKSYLMGESEKLIDKKYPIHSFDIEAEGAF